ncbi:GMC family oxidoreductase [Nonomuraea angiospora]|uniref:Choline dehydrogenase-like flavoprotein n=1 Tax=Nonomuraea angiospora TaxID=46172 RepID=A0ABR9LPJ0_9ACTN|nr:choline dehydrogenase-like flavoprotein [Nonomuraea angiospora]
MSVADGRRMSAARAYLHEAIDRPNVRLVLHCEVRRIIFDGATATGVEAVVPEGVVSFSARREVIVCAGALESPLLLERSGVGDPRVLAAAGVPMVAGNRAIGGNLRQHRGIAFMTQFSEVPGGSAVLPFGTATVAAVLKSDLSASAPDTDLLFYPFVVPGHDGAPARIGGAAVGFYPHSPTSTGSIHITGPGLEHAPRLVPNYLSTDHDRKLLVAGFARFREIVAAEPFASIASSADLPKSEDEEGLVRHSLEHGAVINHPIGTCALGPSGAVDDQLRVRGTDRLRVADASVMPTLPSGNTAAPSMAVGWITGDLILDGVSR